MRKLFTDKELNETLSHLKVIADTREQKNSHVSVYLQNKGVEVISRKLNVGDYSVQLGDETFEDDFVVERKADLDELAGNLTSDRERFEREFTRAKARGTKVFLLVENAAWSDIFAHKYKSQMPPKSLIASLLSWQVRYNVTIILVSQMHSAELIYGLLWYAARERLLGGSNGLS